METDVLKRVPVREQEPKVRAANFEEVCLGYNKEEAMAEATRCLKCKNPQCVKGCPVNIDIPGFIKEVEEGNFDEAYPLPFRQSADASVLRKASVKLNVYVELREMLFQSANLSVLLQILRGKMELNLPKQKQRKARM